MQSLFDLSGKTAIITGSTRGIGKALAEHYALHGANVVISSRTAEACDAVAAEINARGQGRDGHGKAVAIPASISSKDAMAEMVAKSREAFGPIDILVANAASNPYYGPAGGINDEQFRKVLDNNILSNHWLAQMVLPDMIERKDGAIIIVSSIGGLKGSETIGAYGISKAADMQIARNYAVEYGRHNVRTNCIAPGLIRTDFAKALWDNPAAEERFNTSHPMRRMGLSEDLAGAALLLGSRAGAYINGQTLVVDGGSTIAG
jgi:NAD(P)-dependent dehydrogenase (short-subunit alcohol dehydrogenase family)